MRHEDHGVDGQQRQGRAGLRVGLSLLIEHAGRTYLYDTGASGAFVENAGALGCDLGRVDACVLSHAHFDHAGGLDAFAQVNDGAPIFVAEAAQENCYSKAKGELEYIGITNGLLERLGARVVRVAAPREIGPNAFVLGHSEPDLAQAGAAQKMYVGAGEELVPDDFAHEQSLVLVDEDGIVVVNGCCHAGADVVVREAAAAFPGKRVKAVVGGLHLFDRDEATVRAFARDLASTGVDAVIIGHCTGPAMPILAETFGDKLLAFCSGAEFAL